MNIFEKLARIMCWEYQGATAEQAYQFRIGGSVPLPPQDIVDVVYCGSLEEWAKTQSDVKDSDELRDRLLNVCNKAITLELFNDKKNCNTFPPLYNFSIFCNTMQRKGKLYAECQSTAEVVFNGDIVQRRLAENVAKLLDVEQSQKAYDLARKKMQSIWALSDKDCDFLRFFVCQCLAERWNPSQNKSLYLFSTKKGTGKSTFARAFASVLNGDIFENAGKYESDYGRECMFGEHDLPKACQANCVILDEAMPDDTKKSYGQLKKMLTDNMVTYNPKFRSLISLRAKRNYIFTSNNDISKYVQDEKERRFYQINFAEKPNQISFDEIYEVVKAFCQQCTPDDNLQEWYDSFDDVEGKIAIELNDIYNEFANNCDAIFIGSSVTAWSVAKQLYGMGCSREQRDIVKQAMQLHFADCAYAGGKQERYSVSLIVKKLRGFDDVEDITFNNDDDDDIFND